MPGLPTQVAVSRTAGTAGRGVHPPAGVVQMTLRACGRWLVAPAAGVCGRADRHRHRTERGDGARPVAVGSVSRRRQEPGGALEELLAPARGPARLRAAHGVAADEADAVGHGVAERRLGGADVRDGGAVARGGQHVADPLPERPPASRPRVGLLPRRPGSAGSSSAPRSPPRRGTQVGVVAGRARRPRFAASSDRGADQPGADDGELLDVLKLARALGSASRKARSSDWRAFRRGSQSVIAHVQLS
jgi:hypothetical protein